jgi:hypothetical protein
VSIISGDKAERTSEEEGQEAGPKSDEVVLKYYTVWYSVPGESMMYTERDWMCKTLGKAKEITEEDFLKNHWWVSDRPHGWLEIRDQDFNLVSSARSHLKQLGLFG